MQTALPLPLVAPDVPGPADPRRRYVGVWRFGFALASVLAAWGLSMLLAPLAGGAMSDTVSPLFYLAVMLAAWFGGMLPGLLATVCAGFVTAVWFMDPPGSLWIGFDDLMRLGVFICASVLIGSLTANRRRAERSLRRARDELEVRVRMRTRELEVSHAQLLQEVAERRRLERAALEASDREQQRLSHDLHDDLGQELTGIAFLSKAVAETLAAEGRPQAATALEVVGLVNGAIARTRVLSRSLYPAELDFGGLVEALRHLAARTEKSLGIPCDLNADGCDVSDPDLARHLYRIAQEAAGNAIRHGRPTRLSIDLKRDVSTATMTIRDNGVGFTPPPEQSGGMGLQLMGYRARMIGGSLDVRRDTPDGGTCVACTWPLAAEPEGEPNAG